MVAATFQGTFLGFVVMGALGLVLTPYLDMIPGILNSMNMGIDVLNTWGWFKLAWSAFFIFWLVVGLFNLMQQGFNTNPGEE
jgi:hypothetical protein